MDKLKKKDIVFLSFGAYATKSGLIYSQMIKFADYLSSCNVFNSVQSICILPKISTYRRFKTHSKNLKELESSVSSGLFFFNSWLLNGKMFSFIFKKIFYKKLKSKIYDRIQSLDEIIFHCRSYYATDFALYIKEEYPDKNIKVVFDMRSLLPPEFPYTSRLFGKYIYVSGKEWERQLIKKSDLSLLVTQNAIELLKLEDSTYKNIHYIPIIGFEKHQRAGDIESEFDERWKKKSFGYVGSVGLWHNLESIEYVANKLKLDFCSNHDFKIATNNKNLLTKLQTTSIPNDQMPEFYRKQLAVIIPGVVNELDYFKALQMTSNLFSTKASEALSLGVPLIVNNQISELANLVTENECGIVFEYNPEEQKIEFINASNEDLNSKVFWENLTRNAYKLGSNYQKENAQKMYLDYWSLL
ncbi:hypothetical protein J4N45_17595 [Vibrio sp. SCSIO 43140]|uniref:hypothetical protein n=1 Tax=Vibrio sp. SCSIO 43140 TaxID=2819100 RepID=UPI0020751AD0|nr:hypothetical protein [Vibrio sp. SCSIO 43140]USD60282.1 hypothetical protein J4N45_17595 [Vibrio sp. SCSIO 43140]